MMSTISIRLPESLFKRAKELSVKENVSIDQLITLALAEKISALDTETYLQERAKRGSKDKFLKVLEKVRDVEPEEYDRL